MPGWQVVLLKTLMIFAVMLVGWLSRRAGYITAESVRTMSRFVVGIAFPALVFSSLVRTVDANALVQGWFMPIGCGVIILLGLGLGAMASPLFCTRESRPTFAMLVGLSNWIYLPLAIAEGLFGDDGVRVVLLANVGAQVTLWSAVVWTLRGGRPDLRSLAQLLRSPGLAATAAGIFIALVWPGCRELAFGKGIAGVGAFPVAVVFDAMTMIGSVTIPLSILIIGAQLAGSEADGRTPVGAVAGILVLRLVVTPLVVVAIVQLLGSFGLILARAPRMVLYLIALMPIAVSCGVLAERFDGDVSLTARSTFYSTLASIATVPFSYFVITKLGL